MDIIRYSVGVDISKDNFHVAVLTTNDARAHKIQRSGTFDNGPTGFETFIKWCLKEYKRTELPFAIAMEATGTYHERLALALHLAGFTVHIVLPNRAKAYIASFSTGSKNDKADARDLARMCAEQPLDRWNPPGDFFYKLRTLTRHYQVIQEMITATGNQLHALNVSMMPLEAVICSQQHLIDMLKEQLKEIKSAIGKHLCSDKAIWKRAQHPLGIPGIGLLTTAVILAETDGFELFKNVGQLVSYAGYDVIENQSGKHVGRTRISKRGNSRIRRALHMCSLTTITVQTPAMVALYERTFGRHGIKMKSYVAIQKKLLVLMYTLWKKEQDFDPEYKPATTETAQKATLGEDGETTFDKEAGHSSRGLKLPTKNLVLQTVPLRFDPCRARSFRTGQTVNAPTALTAESALALRSTTPRKMVQAPSLRHRRISLPGLVPNVLRAQQQAASLFNHSTFQPLNSINAQATGCICSRFSHSATQLFSHLQPSRSFAVQNFLQPCA